MKVEFGGNEIRFIEENSKVVLRQQNRPGTVYLLEIIAKGADMNQENVNESIINMLTSAVEQSEIICE